MSLCCTASTWRKAPAFLLVHWFPALLQSTLWGFFAAACSGGMCISFQGSAMPVGCPISSLGCRLPSRCWLGPCCSWHHSTALDHYTGIAKWFSQKPDFQNLVSFLYSWQYATMIFFAKSSPDLQCWFNFPGFHRRSQFPSLPPPPFFLFYSIQKYYKIA